MNLLSERNRRVSLWLIFLALAVMPLILWGRGYVVGGDDTRLYYMYPFEYLTRFTPNLISDNQLGSLGNYFSQLYIAPFVVLALIFKTVLPFLQTANLMFGLNIAAGFLGFYYLMGLWFKTDSRSDYLIKVVTGLMYVFSTFTTFSIWQNQLFVVYLVGVFPWLFYLFLSGVRERRPRLVVLAALLLSLFSVVLMSAPWFLAIILVFLPAIAIEFWQDKRSFLKSLGLFVGLVLLMNLYWVFHFVYSPRSTDNSVSDPVSLITADDYRASNIYTIRTVSEYNTLLYPMLGLFHNDIQRSFDWKSYGFYANWNRRFLPFGLILPLIVLAPLLYLNWKNRLRNVYVAAVISWLAALFMFTANIDNWGTNLFIWLNNVVPGFVMFRNMYDKLGPALSFSYAMLLAISLKIIFDGVRNRSVRGVILALLLVFTLIQARPFIFGVFYELPLWTTTKTVPSVDRLNSDFLNLVDYLKSSDDTHRYVWLPLNNANYVQIQSGGDSNHYYSGVSPLQFMAGVNDFSGLLSFSLANKQQTSIKDALLRGDVDQIGEMFRELNVGYIIVNHDINLDLQQSYLYRGVYSAQSAAMIRSLSGEKIKDFGARYSLYKINDRWRNERIFVSGGAKVTFERIADYRYNIHLEGLTADQELYFMDPYHQQWRLTLADNRGTAVPATHGLAFDYANVWSLKAGTVGPSADMILEFQPHRYSGVVNLVSALTMILAVMFVWRRRVNARP